MKNISVVFLTMIISVLSITEGMAEKSVASLDIEDEHSIFDRSLNQINSINKIKALVFGKTLAQVGTVTILAQSQIAQDMLLTASKTATPAIETTANLSTTTDRSNNRGMFTQLGSVIILLLIICITWTHKRMFENLFAKRYNHMM